MRSAPAEIWRARQRARSPRDEAREHKAPLFRRHGFQGRGERVTLQFDRRRGHRRFVRPRSDGPLDGAFSCANAGAVVTRITPMRSSKLCRAATSSAFRKALGSYTSNSIECMPHSGSLSREGGRLPAANCRRE